MSCGFTFSSSVTLLSPDSDFLLFWATQIGKHLEAISLSLNGEYKNCIKGRTDTLVLEWNRFVQLIPRPPSIPQEFRADCILALTAKTRILYDDLEANINKNHTWIGWIPLSFIAILKDIVEMLENMLREKYLDKTNMVIFWIKIFQTHLGIVEQFLSLEEKYWKKKIHE